MNPAAIAFATIISLTTIAAGWIVRSEGITIMAAAKSAMHEIYAEQALTGGSIIMAIGGLGLVIVLSAAGRQ